MPEINRVPFKLDPVGGDLYLDHHRRNFYMERLDDVVDALCEKCMEAGVAREIKGEITFRDDDAPPEIRGLRYSNMTYRMEHGDAFEDDTLELEAE